VKRAAFDHPRRELMQARLADEIRMDRGAWRWRGEPARVVRRRRRDPGPA
jgi:hypothetical protein